MSPKHLIVALVVTMTTTLSGALGAKHAEIMIKRKVSGSARHPRPTAPRPRYA